jgi:hypothetical protein
MCVILRLAANIRGCGILTAAIDLILLLNPATWLLFLTDVGGEEILSTTVAGSGYLKL